MRKISNITILALILGIFVISCGKRDQSENTANNSAPSAESTNTLKKTATSKDNVDETISLQEKLTSKAAKISDLDSIRKFIRKADLEFKVAHVFNATQEIENITTDNGGFIINSTLSNDISNTQTKKVSSDSSVVITEFTVKSNITAKIPKAKLDTFLRSLAPMVVFINKREVTATDIHINMLESELTRLRNQTFADDTEPAKGIVSRRVALEAQGAADAAMIDKLMMLDNVEFSTVNINIYQNKEVRYEMVANENYEKYEPNFGTKLWTSVKTGFYVIEQLFLFAVNLWGVILFGFIVYFASTRIYRRFKKIK